MHGKRSRKSIFFIVIHYTGNNGDTALNNAKFFQKEQTGARNGVGAHFFVGKKGKAVKSIPIVNLISIRKLIGRKVIIKYQIKNKCLVISEFIRCLIVVSYLSSSFKVRKSLLFFFFII